ncbi:D-arabinono-1,4-lactone oxidase [Pengzhenrongella frigida]|uniref:FAD-binding protein n=1 Tax=Pengzhenrongella frigida TaxID=1259133 RepID=A0A4Q5MZR4_9MICO|nr:D-arabinono-1,4-lactone oxidase [Cellulomonas sp. HLT2-17]RYV51230.1 FAD-binding protein [Cellulomonas sp. HLT2-17]
MSPATRAAARAATHRATWENWARTERAHPAAFAAPRDLTELVATVRAAADRGLRLRVVGAGHSFTGVAVTDGVLVRLDHLASVERIVTTQDGGAHVTVGAGIRLRDLNAALAARGLALPNLGDIDRQTIAGAISTGTHGTGARLAGLAGQVRGLRIVTAAGEVLEASPSEHPELFEAARLGLGAVGVLAAVTIEAVPAFTLEAWEEPWALGRVLEALAGPDGLVDGNDHFEFFWFPHTQRTLTKRNNRVVGDQPRTGPGRLRRWVDDELLSNVVFEATNRLTARVPRLTPGVNAVAARTLTARRYRAPSTEVFVSPRRVRFREMEYAIPRADLPAVLAELDRWIEASGERVSFPVEVRFAAADDVWLSTAQGRQTAYVAVHQYARVPYARLFAAAEQIATAAGGRPHWGKLHTLDAAQLTASYPRLDDFRAVRAAQDPGGMFANRYLDRVLGPTHP